MFSKHISNVSYLVILLFSVVFVFSEAPKVEAGFSFFERSKTKRAPTRSAPDVHPESQKDACKIFQDRPSWFISSYSTYKRWKVPPHIPLAFMWQESRFTKDARPIKRQGGRVIYLSSALGYAQSINSTWKWYKKDIGTDIAHRTEFSDSMDFIGWYIAKSNQTLGIGIHDVYNQYLAYHEGHGGFKKKSYKSKPWLMSVAKKVEQKSKKYKKQLEACALMIEEIDYDIKLPDIRSEPISREEINEIITSLDYQEEETNDIYDSEDDENYDVLVEYISSEFSYEDYDEITIDESLIKAIGHDVYQAMELKGKPPPNHDEQTLHDAETLCEAGIKLYCY